MQLGVPDKGVLVSKNFYLYNDIYAQVFYLARSSYTTCACEKLAPQKEFECLSGVYRAKLLNRIQNFFSIRDVLFYEGIEIHFIKERR